MMKLMKFYFAEANEQLEVNPDEQEAKIDACQEASNEQIQYKNMTTIAEESTQIQSSNSAHCSLLNITKFASSTPCVTHKGTMPVITSAVSPIHFNTSIQMTRAPSDDTLCEPSSSAEPKEIPISKTEPSEGDSKKSSKITLTEGGYMQREELAENISSLETNEAPILSAEAANTPMSATRERITIRRGRKTPKKTMNYEEKEDPKEQEVNVKKQDVQQQEPPKVTVRQKRMKSPRVNDENVNSSNVETLEEVVNTKRPKRKGNPINYTEEDSVEYKENKESKGSDADKGRKNIKKTSTLMLADKTNLHQSTSDDSHKPIKVENLEEIEEFEVTRPKRRAAPQNLAEPRLGSKMRRT